MVNIDLRTSENFFSGDGAKIYEIAEKTVDELSMLEYIKSGVLIGMSGGPDSVMLLLFLLELRRRRELDFTILCSHVNHGIRGEEADRDETFCKELCSSLGVELICSGYSVPDLARSSGESIEEAARKVRYLCFNNIIRGRSDLGCVAVAHNMSDCAETVIFNILRGSGARGASGIRPVRDNIVRPLIRISKQDINNALDSAKIPYVIDSTNLSDEYTRNYIRHDVIPSFSRIISDPEKMICRFADNMRNDDDFICSVADEFIRTHEEITNKQLSSLHYSVFVRVLSSLAAKKNASVSYRIASDIYANLASDNFSYSLIGKASFVCERGVCRIGRDTTEGIDFCFNVGDGVTKLSPLNAVFVISKEKLDKSSLNIYNISIQANLSSAIIKGGLYLRSKKDGDTVYYGGMTHKLKKMFSDAKIPRSKRGLIPILCDDNGVVWVPGFGVRDDGVKNDDKEDIYVMLGICCEDGEESDRLYSASEFRT